MERLAMWHVSAGHGDTVVFVHGAFCDYRLWEPQTEGIGRAFRAVAVSLAGYHPGPLLAPEELTAERHIAETGLFLETLERPVHLVGHSRGARISLNVAARFGETIRSLVLIEPGGNVAPDFLLTTKQHAPTPSPSVDMRDDVLKLIKSGQREQGMRVYVDSGHGKGRWDRLSSAVRRIMLSNADTIAGMLQDNTGLLTADAARKISCPTLLIAGGASPPIFGRVLDALQTYIPDQCRKSVANADHFLPWDHAGEVNAILLDWLRTQTT